VTAPRESQSATISGLPPLNRDCLCFEFGVALIEPVRGLRRMTVSRVVIRRQTT